MATYQSTQVANGLPIAAPSTGNTMTAVASASLTTALAVNDVVNLLTIPNGWAICGLTLDCTQLDSNATPTLAGLVQDTGAVQVFIPTATAVGHAATGSVNFQSQGGSTGYAYAIATSGGNPGTTTLQFKCTAAAATWKNGTMTLAVELQQLSGNAGAPLA